MNFFLNSLKTPFNSLVRYRFQKALHSIPSDSPFTIFPSKSDDENLRYGSFPAFNCNSSISSMRFLFGCADLSVASSNSHESHKAINPNCHPNAAITTILRRIADFFLLQNNKRCLHSIYMLVFFNEKTDNITFAGIRCAHRKRKLFRRNYVVFFIHFDFRNETFFVLFSISI